MRLVFIFRFVSSIFNNGLKDKLLKEEVMIFIERIPDKDKTLPDSIITDADLNILYPEQIKTIVKKYHTDNKFKLCIDSHIKNEDRDIVLNFKINNSSESDFKQYVKSLKNILETIEHMNSYTMFACMEHVMTPDNICNGALIESYIQLLTKLNQYVGININLKDANTDKINYIVKETFPHLKAIFKNLIKYSREHPTKCGNKYKEKIDMYETIYKELFVDNKPNISYNLFNDVDWNNNFFKEFTETLYGKIILMLFMAFIFSKLVSLFSPSSSSQIVPPK